MERSSPSDPDVGNTFAQLQAALADRYALERELGHGGVATVYLARDLPHGRPVPIKVPRPEIPPALGPGRVPSGREQAEPERPPMTPRNTAARGHVNTDCGDAH